jgi:hypothetical protein
VKARHAGPQQGHLRNNPTHHRSRLATKSFLSIIDSALNIRDRNIKTFESYGMRCVVVLLAIPRVSTVDFTTGDFMHRWRRPQTLPGNGVQSRACHLADGRRQLRA